MSLLGKVTTGKVKAPYRLLVWGTAGVGKTTLAAQAPAPIFLPVEEGCNNLDVARLPQPQNWGDVLSSIQALTTERHEFKTLIIDTLNAAEPMVWSTVIAAANGSRGAGKVTSIEQVGGGYGKGYVAAVDEWRLMTAMLEKLQRDRGMNVIMLAHPTDPKEFKNPEGDNFDVWKIAMHPSAAGFLVGWSEDVLFARWEVLVATEDKKPSKGISTGRRIVQTQENGPWRAKNRHGMPPVLPLSWPVLAAYLDGASPGDMKARIGCALNSITSAEIKKAAEEALTAAGDDIAKLALVEQRITKKRS